MGIRAFIPHEKQKKNFFDSRQLKCPFSKYCMLIDNIQFIIIIISRSPFRIAELKVEDLNKESKQLETNDDENIKSNN